MSKNKLSKFAEIRELPNVIEVSYADLEQAPFGYRGEWSHRFFGNDFPLVLELGCGKGEYTVGLAEHYPDRNFIGVDIKGARIWTGARSSYDLGIRNAAFLRTHIELLDRFFAPGEVSEIWLTFPDPQMKKQRKRLTSTTFLEHYRHILKPDGRIHLKTDSNFLYHYTSSLVHLNGFPVEAETADLYDSPWADAAMGIRTYYEQQWLDRGMKIKFLSFVPLQGDLREPDVEPEKDDYRSFGRNHGGRIASKG